MDIKLEELIVVEGSKRKISIATAESCTGGLLASTITDVPKSSSIFGFGVVSYSIEAKVKLLGVPRNIIERYGAVSPQTAEAMALGALRVSDADLAVAITGLAGPGDEGPSKPVGLVYICVAIADEKITVQFNFSGTRKEIKAQAVEQALILILQAISKL